MMQAVRTKNEERRKQQRNEYAQLNAYLLLIIINKTIKTTTEPTNAEEAGSQRAGERQETRRLYGLCATEILKQKWCIAVGMMMAERE